MADSMADSESDLETDGLELALDTLYKRHCSDESTLRSKSYCSEFCQLVEEYTSHWQVPLPQLKVLWTALCSFTKATSAFPHDCQHVHYVLSSLALSFFELLLFFSQEEFSEKPLKDILDSFQECYSQLLRHRNVYLHHVKQIIKAGGPWENPVLQRILKEEKLPAKEVEDYLSSELLVFFELRVRYLQACERTQEARALSKSCLENCEAGKHLYFRQAYLTCLYKASLHEHLHKEIAEIDGRDAVEIICNTESIEKDELLLSMGKTFLKQQLNNGDMYYIWDLVFIWSRLHLRAHPSRQGFLAECLDLASSATNVRAIFPFIKLVTTELGSEGVHVCLELCARALQLCDAQADVVTRSLVCKTIAFLLPHDLEICRACALLVFCQERSLEAYRTVCLLYMLPDQEPHPHNSPVPTNVRFHVLQMLKQRLCFDPEFWNLLTLRAHCMELMSDKVMKAAVLSELEEEEAKECHEELLFNTCLNDSRANGLEACQTFEAAVEKQELPVKRLLNAEAENCIDTSNNAAPKRRKWRRRLRRRRQSKSDDEGDPWKDPEFRYNLKSPGVKPTDYSLRHNHAHTENSASLKLPLNRKREYLSRCVKSQILKRKGRKKRWLQGVPRLELTPAVPEKKIKGRGRKRLWRSSQTLELCYPDNEIFSAEFGFVPEEDVMDVAVLKAERQQQTEINHQLQQEDNPEKDSGFEENSDADFGSGIPPRIREDSQPWRDSRERPPNGPRAPPAVEADAALDGEPFALSGCPVEQLHSYCMRPKDADGENAKPPESSASEGHEDTEPEPHTTEDTEMSDTEEMSRQTWRDKALRTQKYAHVKHHCKWCHKDYKGLNVMRHALSHLRAGKLRCILCGKRLRQFSSAKKHILEHIDQMDKDKPLAKEAAVDGKATNGKSDVRANPDPPPVANETPASNEKSNPLPKSKKKVPALKRENRIIRNLRTLIRKTAVLHSKAKNPSANAFKLADFQDEQVVIKEGMVILKESSLQEADGSETAGGRAGEGEGVGSVYYLCPSESCDKVFLNINSTLTKHAIKYHIKEDNVLEKSFDWCKHKCILCARSIQFLEHYKDHMKLHDAPLQHFCYHLECSMRFSTQQELKEHVGTHQPFRPQCRFTDCETLFPNLQCLHDHEWRHYIPTPQREELQVRQNVQIDEAPWKQRVKVEEIWLHNKKEQREPPGDQADLQPFRADDNKHLSTLDNHKVKNEVADGDKAAVNGCKDRTGNQESTVKLSSSQAGAGAGAGAGSGSGADVSPNKSRRNKGPLVVDPLNVRVGEESSTLSEGIQKALGEPHITEHKSFHPKDPSYATFVKAPFVRPPPSTYLDESVLSMRKRRTTEEPAPKINTYWNYKRKENLDAKDEQKQSEAREQKMRTRCNKCLSSFSSVEELQEHQALNTCSALFGFDSDDES